MKFGKFSLLVTVIVLAEAACSQSTDQRLFSQYAMNVFAAQSAACHGDYLVLVRKQVSKMALYNLKSKKMLCKRELVPWQEMRGKTDVYHANNSSFGIQRFKDSDPFPLLYVSHRENNDKRGVLQVYRVIPLKSQNDKTDFDSLSVSLIQTIYYPKMTDKNALGSPWTVIDQENNWMYTYSRNNRRKASNMGVCRISKFRIPLIGESDEVYLNDEDVLDSYEVGFMAPQSQGAFICKGKMYIAQGTSPEKFIWLRIIDLEKKKLVNSIDLKEAGFPKEPEGCFVYDGNLMISTLGKKIFKINIPIE